MKPLIALVAFASITLAAAGWAASGFGAAALVVAVDAKAKTITLKHSDNGVWKETVGTWDDATEWSRADKEVWDEKPATVALASELKKDSKVYVTLYDRGGAKFWIEKLKTIPANFEVK